jgi:tetratricopeptide (TPR) repeat protein
MTDTTFFEQFDHGSKSPRGSRRDPTRLVGIVALVALVLAGAAAALWFLVLKNDDPSPEELLNDALAAHVAGDIAGATELYNEILAEDPTNKFAHYNLGLIAQTQGRPDDAERAYRQALQTDPTYGPALFNLAIIKYEAKQYEDAIDLYRQLLLVEPDNASAHLNLGYALRDNGQAAEGDREIAEAVALDPSLGSGQAPPTTDTTSVSPDPGETTTTTAA